MEEVWRDFPGWKNHQISNYGRIRSFKYLKPNINRGIGYLTINCEGKTMYIHRMVAEAFPEICGTPFPGSVVHHKNEDKTDNRAENLQFVTQSTNLNHGETQSRRLRSYHTNHPYPILIQLTIENEFVNLYHNKREFLEMFPDVKEWTYYDITKRALKNGKAKSMGFLWKIKK